MELVKVLVSSLASLVVMFCSAKLIGKRQLAQMSLFDYINGITLGSIAAELAVSGLEDSWEHALTAMLVYALVVFVIAWLAKKSLVLRRFFDGTAHIIFEDGKLYRKSLQAAQMNVNEFLTECRLQGYFNIAEIQTAILEADGRISILPKASCRPPKNNEMNIAGSEEKPPVVLLIDGKILKRNLRFSGKNEKWLEKQLAAQGIQNPSAVFLATCDADNNLSVYSALQEKPDSDIFL